MTSENHFGAVVFGTNFGVNTHVAALRNAGFDVKALVGRDPEKTKTRAEWANIPLALTSLEEALAVPGVDLVAISTPPHTHAEISLAAFKAGKHVVCEKPFSRDITEAQEMLEAARAAYVTGRGTFQPVIDAERSLRTLELERLRAEADLHTAEADLLRAIGAVPGVDSLSEMGGAR